MRIFEEYNQRPKQENAETDYKERQRFWIEATHRLNKIPGGTMKSTAKWVKYWADVIINLKRKCKLVIEGRSKKIGPSPLEVRILSAATCYDVLDLWTKALSSDGIGVLETSMSGDVHEEYFPDDSGVQKEEIVIEHYASDDPLDEEFVASFSKPVDHCEHSQETSVTTELEIRKPTVEELKNLTNAVTTAEYVELTTSAALEASTSEFLRPKVVHRSVTSSASTSTSTPVNVAAASATTDRLREDLKRTSEKLESVMKRRRLDDSKFAIAQALTNMSAALLQLSNGMNELANALTNDAM